MAIGRMYMVSVGAQAQTAAKTLIEIAAASTKIVQVERLWCGQQSFDTSENLVMKVQRITTTGTGTTTTAIPQQAGDSAFA